MDQILQMILEIVREQQRDAADLRDTMTKAEVVELTMSMMEQQGIDEYHEDLEADIYHRIQYLAPRLFEHEDAPQEPEIHTEKFSYRMNPTEEAILNNENLNLDHMVGSKLQELDSPITMDTTILDYEQTYTHEGPIPFSDSTHFSEEEPQLSKQSETLENTDSQSISEPTSEAISLSETTSLPESISKQVASINPELSEAFQDVLGEDAMNQTNIDEEALNQLVMAKYMELANSDSDNSQIDSTSLASLVMQALQGIPTPSEMPAEDMTEDIDEVDSLLKKIWDSEPNIESSGDFKHEIPNLENISSKEMEHQAPTLEDINSEEMEHKARALENINPEEVEYKDPTSGETSSEEPSHKTPLEKTSLEEPGHKIPLEKAILEEPRHKTPLEKTNLEEASYETTPQNQIMLEQNTISSFYNTKTYMNGFSDYLKTFQENQPILTGFSSIDRILETGLHSGLYYISSDCIDISSFCLQLADQIAMEKTPICYFLFHHSRYECMAKSLSRLTYELRGKEKAYTLSSLYQKQEETNLHSLQPELKYYEEKIASNLYFIETDWRESDVLLSNIKQAVQTIEQTVGQKPVILLDDLSICREIENLIPRLEYLCSNLEITLMISANRRLEYIEDNTYSSIEIELTDLPEQNSFTKREIILENGDSILLDINFIDGGSRQEKRCQLFSTPKFYYFKSR